MIGAYILSGVLGCIQTLMVLRIFFSFFVRNPQNIVLQFSSAMTEPFVYPVRVLFDTFGLFEDSPIDIAFFLVYMLISISDTLICGIYGV